MFFLSILPLFFTLSLPLRLQEAAFRRAPLLSPPVQELTFAFLLRPPLRSSPQMRTCAAPAACSVLWLDEWHVAQSATAATAHRSILRSRRATRERERRGERGV